MYLSASTREFFKDLERGGPVVHGAMFNSAQQTGRENEALEAGIIFGVDNGVFSGKFKEKTWLLKLWKFWPYRHNCVVYPLPDFLYQLPDGAVRGDWEKTLEKFHQYKRVTKRLGFPVTLVTQDGLTPENTPWDDLDAIFVGGSDAHKRGIEAQNLCLEAERRGKYIHIGRVSSVSTAQLHWPMADSYDGTTYNYEPDSKYENYTPQWIEYFGQDKSKRPRQYKLL